MSTLMVVEAVISNSWIKKNLSQRLKLNQKHHKGSLRRDGYVYIPARKFWTYGCN